MFSSPRAHPTDQLFLFLEYRLTKAKKGITMAKPILDEAHAKQCLAELKTNNDVKFELNMELLTELRNIAYSGRVEEDVVDHIAKILEILDLIKIANVDPFQLRMKVFPLSLAGDARKWWMNEGDGKINTWEELGKKFLFKDHKKVDETTKQALLHSWIGEGKNEGLMDDIVSSDDDGMKWL
ncbi:hypothetical protein Tco_0390055 [Tanacetum coccineum]